MRCTTCGADIPAGAAFCPHCGTRTPPAPPTSTAGQPTTLIGERDNPLDYPQPPISMPPPEGGYAPPGYYQAQQPPNSTAAIVSLVFGVLAWTVLPFVGAIVAIVAGHMGRNEVRRSGGQIRGDGLAVAGMIMGYAQIALSLLVLCIIVAIGMLTLVGARAS